MNTSDTGLRFDLNSTLNSEPFDIDAAAEVSGRLHILLTDSDGRGMATWYVAVGSVMRELCEAMQWKECV